MLMFLSFVGFLCGFLKWVLRKINRVQQSEDAASDDGQNPESSRQRDVHTQDRSTESISKEDPVLQSNHKIFLSHSGHQKDFAEELCGDLEKRHRFPFFDRRPSSLPKGERFPELIFKAAEQCVMAVVVVSDEYFTSKWPMLELNAFVRTREMQEKLKRDTKLKIPPLFYGLSLLEFRDKTRRKKWLRLWEGWAKKDPRIVVSEWKHCLEVMASFNGLTYHRETRAVKAYRDEIVNHMCSIIPSDIEWDDSHVRGGSYLCQVIQDRIQQIQLLKQSGVCLVGVYGVGGLGKTTLCKILCNKLCEEFKGKVGHVELGSRSCEGLLKEVLKDITNTDRDFQKLNEGQCWNVLRNDACKQKMFLAIDNVWPNTESIEEAKKYLKAGFHKESVVMVTSRALETLTSLGVSRSQCFAMPSLGDEDAMNLFLHHAAYGVQFPSHNDNKRAIAGCVARGYFREGGNDKSGHYLPLALKALGVQLGYAGKSPSEWEQALPEVWDFNSLKEEKNPVFSILRSSFDCLGPVYQSLFMDLTLFRPSSDTFFKDIKKTLGLMEWLGLVYKQDIQVIETWLQHLKGRGLLEDVDMTCQRVYVHDVYHEFARLEAEGKLNESAEFGRRKWVYYSDTFPAELETTPDRSCWQNLIRVGIVEDEFSYYPSAVDSLQGIEWLNCSNVVVLQLWGLHELRGDLNLKGLKRLRSLELCRISALDTLDGLQDLNDLTYFRWSSSFFDWSHHTRMGQLPASLKALDLERDVLLRSDAFACCTKLSMVKFGNCHAECLDFSNCTSLQRARFSDCDAVETLDFTNCTSLECVELVRLHSLKTVSGLSPASISRPVTCDRVLSRVG